MRAHAYAPTLRAELAQIGATPSPVRLAVTEACTNVVRHAYDDVERENANAMRVDLLPSEHAMDVIVGIAMSFAPASIEAA